MPCSVGTCFRLSWGLSSQFAFGIHSWDPTQYSWGSIWFYSTHHDSEIGCQKPVRSVKSACLICLIPSSISNYHELAVFFGFFNLGRHVSGSLAIRKYLEDMEKTWEDAIYSKNPGRTCWHFLGTPTIPYSPIKNINISRLYKPIILTLYY